MGLPPTSWKAIPATTSAGKPYFAAAALMTSLLSLIHRCRNWSSVSPTPTCQRAKSAVPQVRLPPGSRAAWSRTSRRVVDTRPVAAGLVASGISPTPESRTFGPCRASAISCRIPGVELMIDSALAESAR